MNYCKKILLLMAFMCSVVSCTPINTQSHANTGINAWVEAGTGPLAANHFHTVAAAINAAPEASTKPYKIFIAAGNYYEKILITKPNIILIGAGPEQTKIYFDVFAGQVKPDGSNWGTFESATLIVRAEGVQLHQLTIENTYDYLANDALEKDDPKRQNGSQAVALSLDTGSDKFIATHIQLLGFQDTLYVNAGRALFDKSLIAGNVDFIFGKGNAVFTQSEIKTLARARANNPHGYLVAPSTQISDEFGFTFIDCKLTRDASVADNTVPLGRPWHPTTTFADGRYADPNAIGKAVFINNWMDKHITTDGWYSMGGTMRDGTKAPFFPEDARFFEYHSKGPGAVINSKRRQISEADISRYSLKNIFGDWTPAPAL